MMQRLPRVSVLGAGRMGTAIAYMFAQSDHDVMLFDPVPGASDNARARIRELPAVLGHGPVSTVAAGTLTEAVGHADLIVEAAPENVATKRELYDAIGPRLGPDTLVATNTSSLALESFASGVRARERVLYAHFWNPAYAVRLVEVAPGDGTAAAAIATVCDWLTGAGFAPVALARAVPGLVGNRLQHALKREAIALVANGVCDATTIDEVVKQGFGGRMSVLGPMEQSDLVGLDLTLAIHRSLIPDLDVTPSANDYLVDCVERGDLGMATGQGFRTWTAASAQEVRDRLDAWSAAASRPAHRPRPPTSGDQDSRSEQ